MMGTYGLWLFTKITKNNILLIKQSLMYKIKLFIYRFTLVIIHIIIYFVKYQK